MKNRNKWLYVGTTVLFVIAIFVFLLYANTRSAFGTTSSNGNVSLSMGAFYSVQGTSIYVATIRDTVDRFSGSGGSRWFDFGGSSPIANLVFLDARTLSSQTLYETN